MARPPRIRNPGKGHIPTGYYLGRTDAQVGDVQLLPNPTAGQPAGAGAFVGTAAVGVTSVALALPSAVFSISGSPVTTTGTLTGSFQTQVKNLVWAGPASGSDAAPTFRSLVAADLPNTAVTPGSYTYSSFTVDAQGRLTAASNGTAPVTSVATGTGLTGGPITTTGTISLANTAVTPGSYTATNLTVDQQGRLTAASSGSATNLPAVVPPQGRLTLTSNTPVMTADTTAATTVYYDSYVGNLVPVAGAMLTIGSDQISMGLDAGTPHVALNNVYDIFAINNGGTLVIAVGPAWINTATVTTTVASPCVVSWTGHGLTESAPVVFTGAGLPTGITAGTTYFVGRSPAANTFNISTTVANAAAGTFINTTGTSTGTQTGTNNTTIRGTGAGTTQLSLSNGIWTNANSLTHAWGGALGTTDYGSLAAGAGTYLGSLFATANGQTGMMFLPAGANGGTDNILGLYNAYNRTESISVERDSTTSWTKAAGGSWGAANANVKNRVTYLDGLGQSRAEGLYSVVAQANAAATTVCQNAVDFGSTAATPLTMFGQFDANAVVPEANIVSENNQIALGLSYAQAVEQAVTNTAKFFGGAGGMYLRLKIMN